MIGLYDADMHLYTDSGFNLELMKLAAYYKKKHQIISMIDNFDTSRYNKIIYRKDLNDGYFNSDILLLPEIEYGGLAFSQYVYQPLDEEIELISPDVSIYFKYEKSGYFTPELFTMLKNAHHLRLSLDGMTIWPKYRRQIEDSKSYTYCFHDFDINAIEGSAHELKRLLDMLEVTSKRICFRFPIQVNNLGDLSKWINFPYLAKSVVLQYNDYLTDEQIIEIDFRNKSTQYTVQYNPTAGKDLHNMTESEMIDLLYQVLFLSNRRLKFPIIYPNNYFDDSVMSEFINCLNAYNNSMSDSMFFRTIRNRMPINTFLLSPKRPKDNVDTAARTLSQIKSKYPALYHEMLYCYRTELKGGKFICHQ